ncbi:hypothetical protein BC941DRAFT_359322 [Chlamydoabsidia padenii]|nr:hypothetical protein BC941DRAFT_359322 [Chlamydoabsidia padenii]
MPDEHPAPPASVNDTSSTPATTTDEPPADSSNNNNTPSSVLIGLQIKSLEQRTHSVTLPRNASVLELKNEIQATLDVDSGRQRLIFQGKVLKDDKNLTDYANLDDGKVIHLVIRPLDAPQNPMNDEPRPSSRRIFGNRGRPFPSIASRLPMMEGYTFITLDAHIGDAGDNNSVKTVSNTNTTSSNNRSSTTSTNNNNNNNNNNNGDSSNTNTTTTTNSNNNNNITSSDSRSSIRLPFPSSVEMRLSRTVAYIRNVTNILAAPVDQRKSNNKTSNQDIQIPYTSASSPDFIQEIRSSLRGNGNSQSYQVGTVMNELADLMELGTPWLRETARTLQEDGSQTSNQVSRIIKGVGDMTE